MAPETELVTLGNEKLPEGRSVRIVAGGAPVQQRRMQPLHLHHVLHVRMTTEAQVAAVLPQERLIAGLMREMAGQALPLRIRGMKIAEIHLVRMAGKAEVLARLYEQLVLVRNMRSVTGGAPAVLHRGVDIGLLAERSMAHLAERGRVLDEFPAPPALL